VDLLEDSWVVGTPLRMRASDEGTSLADLRKDALADAQPVLAELGISVPADVIALIGDGVPEQDGDSLRFGLPGYGPGTVRSDHELRLETFPAAAASPCLDWFGVEPLGYALTLTTGEEERLLHRDDTLPRSRGCPQDYRLYAVAVPFNSAEGEGAVAILSVYPFGFEGPDRRFLAVPLGL
jgi:predicted secreted protein